MVMADRWNGHRSRSRSKSLGRQELRRGRPSSPQGGRRRSSTSPQEQRRHSPARDKQRLRLRSKSRSRSRSRAHYNSRREWSPLRGRNRSPPSRGYGGRRSSSRSPPPRGHPRRWGPPSQDRRGPPPQLMQSDVPPEVGSIHHARVVSVRPFGAFVELPGYRKQALVHHTQISDEIHFGREEDDEMKVKAMEFFVPCGEQAWVKILEVRQEGPGPQGLKLAASMRAVSQEDGRDMDPDNVLALSGRGGPGGPGGGPRGGGRDSDEPPELYSIHKAEVQQVRPFGVFVKMDGFRKYGLVHFSQISDHLSFTREDADEVKVKEIGEILTVGDPVFVKVVDITQDDRGPKIGCSIKYVSQSDGTDLDLSNTKYRPRGTGGGSFQGQQPIGAAAGAAHDGAVDWGHLKADVVHYGTGGQQYEILAGGSDDEHGRGLPGPGGPSLSQCPPPPGMASGANMAPLPSRGRGGGAVLPAWMTGGSCVPAVMPPPSGAQVTSTVQALAILEAAAQAKREKREKRKKHKKGKKEKRSMKEKRSKRKKEKHSRHSSGSDSSDSSGSD